MTATDLLTALAAQDIHLLLEDGGLVIDAPAGTLTPELRQQIAGNKPDLLALLGAAPLAERASDPYRCPRCRGVARPPWVRVGPDAWQSSCSAGHTIQRTALSFDLPAQATMAGKTPALDAPEEPLPLWLWDALHPLPGIAPTAPPPGLPAAEIASEVAAARAAFDRLVAKRTANPPRPRPTFGPCVRCGTLNWYQDGAGTWRCGCCTPRLEGSKA